MITFNHLNKRNFGHGFGDTVNSMCGCNVEIVDTEHFLLCCHFYSILWFEPFNNINKVDPSFIQLYNKEQVCILLYGYPSNKSNVWNQDIIRFVISFPKKSGRFDKPFISLNRWFYVLLFFFFPICLLYVIIFLLENNCKIFAYNWLQISCINTVLLINSSLLFLFLLVTNYNRQILNILRSFIISVWLIMNIKSFVFFYVSLFTFSCISCL